MKNKTKKQEEKKVLENTTEENLHITSGTINTNDIKPKKRQIILETDGNSVALIHSEVAGTIELQAILSLMLEALKKQ